MSDVDAFRRLVGQSPAVAAAIVRFNSQLSADLPVDGQRRLLPELPDAIWRDPRLSNRLSALLLQRSGLGGKVFADIPNSLWPVALLPADRLHRLARHTGALILGFRIRSSLSREHVLGWKQKLGEDAYRFAMNSAALLPSGRVPLASIVSDSADDVGASVILAAIAESPEAFRVRIAMKLPDRTAPMAIEADKAARLLITVAQIVEGEWFSSFAMLRN
jgi:hypothetical protein